MRIRTYPKRLPATDPTMSHLLHSYVKGENALARLQEHARALLKAQQLLHARLPPYLREHCAVANYQDSVLVVQANNGAVAVKLKQVVPGLIQALRLSGLAVSDIRIKVGVVVPKPPAPPPPRRSITASSIANIGGLMTQLPEGDPLREALERLVTHSRHRAG